MISRSLGSSEKYFALQSSENGLADFCHILFPLLVVNADDVGRLQGDAFTVKHTVFPISCHSIEDFETALQALHSVGLIARYRDGLRLFIQIVNFKSHQPGLLKTANSHLPPPDAAARAHIEKSGEFPHLLESSGTFQKHPESARKLRLKEGRKEGEGSTPYSPPEGGHALKKRPTRSELQQAERIRRNRHGCAHQPRCQNASQCLNLVVFEIRQRGKAGN